jgi:hypothetical protein
MYSSEHVQTNRASTIMVQLIRHSQLLCISLVEKWPMLNFNFIWVNIRVSCLTFSTDIRKLALDMESQLYGLEGELDRIVMFAFTVVICGTDTTEL